MTNNASMEEIYKFEVETLRKVLAEKDDDLKKCAKLLYEYAHSFEQCHCEQAKELILKIGVNK